MDTPYNDLPRNRDIVFLNNYGIHATTVSKSVNIIVYFLPYVFASLPDISAPNAAPGAIREDNSPMYILFYSHYHSNYAFIISRFEFIMASP